MKRRPGEESEWISIMRTDVPTAQRAKQDGQGADIHEEDEEDEAEEGKKRA